MADHDKEEEFLEIGILLFLRQRSRKARKVPTSRKKNIWVRKVHPVKELSLGFIFEVGRLFIVQQVYLRTASASFSLNLATICYVLERDRTLPSCFSADRKTADILMFMLMLMHDWFTHAT